MNKIKKIGAAAVVFALGAGAVTVAGAGGVATGTGGPLHGVVIATSEPNDSTSNNNTLPTDFRGMQATVTVPTTAILDLRFSAESRCTGGAVGDANWCWAQILVNGSPALPVDPSGTRDFAFDATNNGAASLGNFTAHAMERCKIVPAGTYRITVQGAVTKLPVIFWTGERTLVAQWDKYTSGTCGGVQSTPVGAAQAS